MESIILTEDDINDLIWDLQKLLDIIKTDGKQNKEVLKNCLTEICRSLEDIKALRELNYRSISLSNFIIEEED